MRIITYNKLIRDEILPFLEKIGVQYKSRILTNNEEYVQYLELKIKEEAAEIAEALLPLSTGLSRNSTANYSLFCKEYSNIVPLPESDIDSKKLEHLVEELADLTEVLFALSTVSKNTYLDEVDIISSISKKFDISISRIAQKTTEKKISKGGFKKRILLLETTEA